MASLEKIKEEAAAERALLRAERSKVVARIGELQDLDELTAAEGKQLKDLKAYRDELTEAMLDLSLVTIPRLDNSDEVKALAGRIKSAAEEISEVIARIKKIKEIASIVSDVSGGVSKLAQKIDELVEDDSD